MKLLKLEFFKCRRRKIVLVCAAVLAAELLWFGMYLTRQDAEDLVEGWMMLFYNLACRTTIDIGQKNKKG